MQKEGLKPKKIEKLIQNYQQRQSLSDYIKLRRTAGFVAIDSNRFFDFDVMLRLSGELRKFNINSRVVAKILDGNELMVDELCLQLMESIESRRLLEREGRKHVQARKDAIPDSLVDFLLVFAMEACEHHLFAVPSSLVILLRERLGGSNPTRYDDFIVSQKRHAAIQLAISDLKNGNKISIRRVAKYLGVQPSTVKRWFPESSLAEAAITFNEQVEEIRAFIKK